MKNKILNYYTMPRKLIQSCITSCWLDNAKKTNPIVYHWKVNTIYPNSLAIGINKPLWIALWGCHINKIFYEVEGAIIQEKLINFDHKESKANEVVELHVSSFHVAAYVHNVHWIFERNGESMAKRYTSLGRMWNRWLFTKIIMVI